MVSLYNFMLRVFKHIAIESVPVYGTYVLSWTLHMGMSCVIIERALQAVVVSISQVRIEIIMSTS